ncbi:hypothetical protein [Haladaptatus sp. DYF46]|uniref:hypothetical protein n=1 Tax=Haladaptatus sp. DYF46 TaxID=2886041 RepID=UPI001E4A037A|nr:hypothetical protein [Haladaptatus sp. DYF46]
MLRLVVALFGIIEALFPRRLIDVATRASYEGDEEFEPKPWVVTAARIEGILFVLLALFGAIRRRGTRPPTTDEG